VLVKIKTPIDLPMVGKMQIGDRLLITGTIYTGRDAALPLLVEAIKKNCLKDLHLNLEGEIILHSGVSNAGIGSTSSNKVEIEESIPVLAQAGIRIHIGKGSLSKQTISALHELHSVFAVIPPVNALLLKTIVSKEVVAFPEQGFEAMHRLVVKDFPALVAVSQGKSIYEKRDQESDRDG
jgi:fumarate hydratase subunit beta